MKSFKNNQRVKIREFHVETLIGKAGTVRRLRKGDNAAWVEMDEELPEEHQAFPNGDAHGREKHLLLYPDECEPVKRSWSDGRLPG